MYVLSYHKTHGEDVEYANDKNFNGIIYLGKNKRSISEKKIKIAIQYIINRINWKNDSRYIRNSNDDSITKYKSIYVFKLQYVNDLVKFCKSVSYNNMKNIFDYLEKFGTEFDLIIPKKVYKDRTGRMPKKDTITTFKFSIQKVLDLSKMGM